MNIYKDCAFIKQGSPLIIAVDFDDTLVEAGDKFPEIKRPTKLMTQLVELKNNPLYTLTKPLNTVKSMVLPLMQSMRKHQLLSDGSQRDENHSLISTLMTVDSAWRSLICQ